MAKVIEYREDALNATRAAVENAASVAGLLLMTEALIAEKPEKKNGPPAGIPPGGDLDY